jgi:hypothetical protein
MARFVYVVSVLVLVAQVAGCNNIGQVTVQPPEPTGSGGAIGSDAAADVQFTVDVAPPPSRDADVFEAESMPTCAKAVPSVKNVPPDVLIVLDRSGSMAHGIDDQNCNTATGNCANGDKWMQVTGAINAFVPNTQNSVNWGLMFFGDSHVSGTTCDVGTSADVAPGAGNAMAIQTAIAGTSPASSTPTTVAVKNAAAYLMGLNDSNPKFILLATDGLPTCGTSSCTAGSGGTIGSGGTTGGSGGRTGSGGAGGRTVVGIPPGGFGMTMTCDDAAAIAAVKDAHDVGQIPTFVVGIATAGMGDTTLNQMAVNGGFPRTTGTTQYYSVSSGDELQMALQSITVMTKSCFFGIDPPIDAMHKIDKVTADGRELGPSDYMQVGNSGIQLIDQTCTDFTSGTITDVVVQVNCSNG